MAARTNMNLNKLTVVQLQEELKQCGLTKSGAKATLIERLLEHKEKNKADVHENESDVEDISETVKFIDDCYNKKIEDNLTAVHADTECIVPSQVQRNCCTNKSYFHKRN